MGLGEGRQHFGGQRDADGAEVGRRDRLTGADLVGSHEHRGLALAPPEHRERQDHTDDPSQRHDHVASRRPTAAATHRPGPGARGG